MANRRMIDSNLFEDDFVGSMDFFGRYLWIGLFSAVVDDQGRCPDNAAIIRARVFPFDAVNDVQVEDVLARMAEDGKILRYQAGAKKLIQIVHWWDYQQPSWASASKYTAPEGWIDRTKYHAKGNKIAMENWELAGGFCVLRSEPTMGEGSALGSDLDSAIDEKKSEKKQKCEQKCEQKGEQKQKDAREARESAAGGAEAREHGEIFRVFEEEIGPLTPMIADALIDIEQEYPPGWFRMACREAILHNARNMSYVKSILKRWKVQGLPDASGQAGKANGSGNGHVPRAKYDTSELDGLISAGG